MKALYLICIGILLSFVVVSCDHDQIDAGSIEAVRLSASMTSYSEVTFMQEAHIWEDSDQVTVVTTDQEEASDVAEAITSGVTESFFMYSLTLKEDVSTIVGFFPHDCGMTVDDGRLSFIIPEEQDGRIVRMAAGKTSYRRQTYEGGKMTLKPVFKIVPVWIERGNRHVSSIRLTAKDGSMISGSTSIDISSWTSRAMSSGVTVRLEEPADCSRGGVCIPVMVADNDTDIYTAEITTLEGDTFSMDVTDNMTRQDKEYELGISQALFGSLSKSEAASMISAGVRYIEVTMNTFWRGYTAEECYSRARITKDIIEKTSGLEVWSVHLPFSGSLDISVTDDAARAANVQIMSDMIRLAGEFTPKKLVLHPSSEPIAEKDREARLKCSKESIGMLLKVAKEIGAELCIENLPRTCLGRTSDEMRYLIEDYPEVMVCFDSNHLLIETHDSFFRNVGDRIGTIHASDYDMTDERHWMPGKGVINWPSFLTSLIHYGYDGVFMTEVKQGTAAEVAASYKNVICKTE
jgi:sugar phosphate isomerase/epimerase